jgi:hypothetical protein
MLVDPVTVAASSPTPELKLSVVKADGYGSERVDTNANGYSVVINHTRGKVNGANRHYVNLTQTKDITDPYTGTVRKSSASVSMSITRPIVGWTDADIIALAKALTDFRDDSEVTTARLIQFQS